MHVSTILDSPLGKATVKAKSITDSEEESVAADKSFSSKDKSVGRGGGGGRERGKREIWYSKQMMSHDLILSLPHSSPPLPFPPLPSIPFSTPLPSPPQSGVLPPPLHGGGTEGRSVHPHSEVRPVAVGYAHGSPMLTWYAHSGKVVVTLW